MISDDEHQGIKSIVAVVWAAGWFGGYIAGYPWVGIGFFVGGPVVMALILWWEER